MSVKQTASVGNYPQHRAPTQVPPTKSFPNKSQSGLKLEGHRISRLIQNFAKQVGYVYQVGWVAAALGRFTELKSVIHTSASVHPSKCILMREDGTNSM